MYFIIIRPQQKKAKEHNLMVNALKRGDQILTQGGIIGKVSKIKDESGQTFDVGIRGKNKGFLRFDINYFALIYNDRIGLISKQVEEIPGYTTVKTERGNIGNAHIKGIESLLDFNLGNLFSIKNKLIQRFDPDAVTPKKSTANSKISIIA